MRTLYERYQDWMMAITFAEAGEWDTAMEMMPREGKRVPFLALQLKLRDLQKTFMAVSFAEAGEWDTAREMMPRARKRVMFPALQLKLEELQKTFTAVTFAEAGLHDEAMKIMDQKPDLQVQTFEDFLEAIGLQDVPVTYAVAARVS